MVGPLCRSHFPLVHGEPGAELHLNSKACQVHALLGLDTGWGSCAGAASLCCKRTQARSAVAQQHIPCVLASRQALHSNAPAPRHRKACLGRLPLQRHLAWPPSPTRVLQQVLDQSRAHLCSCTSKGALQALSHSAGGVGSEGPDGHLIHDQVLPWQIGAVVVCPPVKWL